MHSNKNTYSLAMLGSYFVQLVGKMFTYKTAKNLCLEDNQ